LSWLHVVLVWLRRHPEVGPLNILMYTSGLTPEQRVRAVELGAKACVNKPVTGEEWSVLVERFRGLATGCRCGSFTCQVIR
jgi:DNA-binding response OmpR family regulator